MDSEQPKAILFDLDDTIATWDAGSEQVWLDVCRHFAPRIAGMEADRLNTTIREVRAWYISDKDRHRYMRLNLEKARREEVGMAFARLGIDAPHIANELADLYNVERVTATSLIPGAIDTLKRYKDTNLRLALLTNGSSKDQRRKIERFGLASLFDFILIEEEMGFGKPDERVFLKALEKLNVTPAEAWMVGDDLERDIGGAKNVGIFGVWVDWKGTGLLASAGVRPDKIINAISELL